MAMFAINNAMPSKKDMVSNLSSLYKNIITNKFIEISDKIPKILRNF